jgi:DNA-binding transcriptional LysR family regulator
MDLSVTKLQQLVCVARSGSFSKAALELHLSQPALSRSIAAMEERYGFKIFNRLGHGVQLTAAGEQVIADAEPLLRSMRAFDHNLRLFGEGKTGGLHIGMSPLLASEVLADLAREFFLPGSSVQLQVMVRPGADLLDALRNDAIELFFFPEGHIEPSAELEIVPLGQVEPICVVRAGHPLAGRHGLSLSDLGDYPWASSIDPPAGTKHRSKARFVCDNYHILRDTLLSSDLICICSLGFIARELEQGLLQPIRVSDLPLTLTTIYMARLRGRMSSPLAIEATARMTDHLHRQREQLAR